jgi:hypothetical protein
MSEYIHLIGAEQVQHAASSIRDSADKIQSAANSISESIDRFIRFMDSYELKNPHA